VKARNWFIWTASRCVSEAAIPRYHGTPMRRRLGVYRHGDAATGFPDVKSVEGKQIIKHAPPAIRWPSQRCQKMPTDFSGLGAQIKLANSRSWEL
jgi:hypothetical protein